MMTDFRPRCPVNAELMTLLGQEGMVKSSYEARMYLQRNADKFLEQERAKAVARLAPCAPCNKPFNQPGTMLPEQWVVRCNGVTCERVLNDPNGVGDGRQY